MNDRPRPVVNASRIVAGLSLLANGLPPLLMAFGLLDWEVDQLAAYEAFIGVSVAAVAITFGLRNEGAVTPVADPRDNGLVPLVPIANDSLED